MPATAGRQARTDSAERADDGDGDGRTRRTYKTAPAARPDDGPVEERPKIAVAVRLDLEVWQKLNVTAFLTSGITAHRPDLVGDPYEDADGQAYLPLLGTPVLVFGGDAPALARAHRRTLDRGLAVAVYTDAMFATGNDVDNRAVVRAVATDDLALAGVAVAGPARTVDKVVDKLRLHP
jgi:hypothetical protein